VVFQQGGSQADVYSVLTYESLSQEHGVKEDANSTFILNNSGYLTRIPFQIHKAEVAVSISASYKRQWAVGIIRRPGLYQRVAVRFPPYQTRTREITEFHIARSFANPPAEGQEAQDDFPVAVSVCLCATIPG